MNGQVPRADRPRIAVITLVDGEHGFLLSQVDGLAVSSWPPDVHVVASGGDRELTRGRLPIRCDRWDTLVPRLPRHGAREEIFLPAFDVASRHAVRAGAQVLVFLAVRAIPSVRLVQTLAEHAVSSQGAEPVLWCAPVIRLLPAPPTGYPVAGDLDRLVSDHPGPRPPAEGSSCGLTLSEGFAVTADDWVRIRTRAWGEQGPPAGEPGDLAEAVVAGAGRIRQVSGAQVYVQHASGSALTFKGPGRPLQLRDSA
jgi:hypothetical protein